MTASGFDMWYACMYVLHIAKMIHRRNVPDELYRLLKARSWKACPSRSISQVRSARTLSDSPCTNYVSGFTSGCAWCQTYPPPTPP